MNFITDKIAIGDSFDAESIVGLRDQGIRSVISLNGQLMGVSAEQLGVEALLALSLGDSVLVDRDEFDLAVSTLERFAKSHSPVLVHCTEGRSRSVMVVATHLMRSLKVSFEDAIERIQEERPIVPSASRLRDHWGVDHRWPVAAEED